MLGLHFSSSSLLEIDVQSGFGPYQQHFVVVVGILGKTVWIARGEKISYGESSLDGSSCTRTCNGTRSCNSAGAAGPPLPCT